MAVPLKLILGIGTVGTAAVATPIVITQLPKSSTAGVEKKGETNRDQSTSAPASSSVPAPSPASMKPAETPKPVTGTKVPCLGKTTYGLKVGGRVVLWAANQTSVEDKNKNEHEGKGEVIKGKDEVCADSYIEGENN